MKSVDDILLANDERRIQFFDHKLAFVQFTVSYYSEGDFIDYDEIESNLWDGQEGWGYRPITGTGRRFLPDGKDVINMEVDCRKDGIWTKCLKSGIVLTKDTFAITDVEVFGNSIGSELALQFELDCIGKDIFDGHEPDILRIARSLSRPKAKDDQYTTFVTVWKMVYEEHHSYDSMYPEYDSWAEMIGAIDLEKLKESDCFIDGV